MTVNKVHWNEVEPAAREAFRVWTNHPELKWAELAWAKLEEGGLTSYVTETERHRVLLRFIVLPGFYLDWTSVADDQTEEDNMSYWSWFLHFSPFILGQLAGEDLGVDDVDEDSLRCVRAIEYLVPPVRDEVVLGLTKGFGGIDGLFLSLWRILRPERNLRKSGDWGDDNYHDSTESDWEVLNNLTDNKHRGYEWVSSGCPPLYRG